MNGIHPECPDSAPPDRSVPADVLLRQEPDEEEDDEDDEDDSSAAKWHAEAIHEVWDGA